jgi:DNA end-binding protein Ku
MSARATWKGVLKISLVTIPIKVFPATEASDGLQFHQLHESCQTRVAQRKWCVSCGREVRSAEIVKGFEFEPGKFVILSAQDFDAVRPPSTRIIDLVQFADARALDPTYVQRTYYLAPDGTGGPAFGVMREGMRGMIGIGKLALYGREYLVAVRPQRQALLLHTLHHAAEIRALDEQAEIPSVVLDPKQITLARQVIAAIRGPKGDALDLVPYHDEYRDGLQALIDKKILGEEIVVPAIDTPPMLNLREALTESLAAVAVAKRTPLGIKPARRKRAG